jgi:hypothetical protein
MNSFFDLLFHDPVMLAAAVVLAGTIAILLWAFKTLNETAIAPDEAPYEDISTQEQIHDDENSGLTEARLQAIVNQLNDISQRLTDIEKILKTTKPSDQTFPMLTTPAKIDETLKRFETKIDALAAVKTGSGGAPVDISALETKLEGIHKLLIYLTDSGK